MYTCVLQIDEEQQRARDGELLLDGHDDHRGRRRKSEAKFLNMVRSLMIFVFSE